MNIQNSNTYNNQIYQAIVVNENYQNDPEELGRVQIYIPSMQSEYASIYKQYMALGNKESSQYYKNFPWAISLVNDLKNGNIVYGNFINNDYSQFIILGLQANISVNDNSISTGTAYNIKGSTLLNYATAIIIENEVDNFNHNDYLNGTIPESCYGQIECDDNGAWSIGLIQWHAVNAFNILLTIKNELSDWKDYWSDKDLYLYKDLYKGSAGNNNYNTFKLTENSSAYNSVKAMLTTGTGKKVQLEHSSDFVYSYLSDLQDNYGISNPLVLIWLADFMNQYGPNITNTKKKAAEICNGNPDNVQALNEFISYCEQNYASYNKYKNRRENVRAYVMQLESEGKLTSGGLTDEGYINFNGNSKYCYPFQGTATITATYGAGGYRSYNSSYQYSLRGILHYHEGVDFGLPTGTVLYACTDGNISVYYSNSGYGNRVELYDDNDKYMVLYGHCSQFLITSGHVTKGTPIALSGNSGNSSGPHLHFEIRKSPFDTLDDVNPLPFIGINQNHELYDKEVTF